MKMPKQRDVTGQLDPNRQWEADLEERMTTDKQPNPPKGYESWLNYVLDSFSQPGLTRCQEARYAMNELAAIIAAHAPDIDAALLAAKRGQAEADCKAIREQCGACENGLFARDHRGDPVECEYCGRPMRAIRSNWKQSHGDDLP